MKTVFKYPLEVADTISVSLPVGAKPLRFDFQGYQLCLWALVDRDATLVKPFFFRMAGTGHDLKNPEMEYVNTAFIDNLVFHFFWLP